VLYGFGKKIAENCEQAPETTRLIEQIPGIRTVWFSILAPKYHIPEHRGVSRAMLVSHLALIIPGDGSQCRIRVHDQTRNWQEGKVMMFDDNYMHEVWNDSDEERVVLFMNLDRPMRFWGRQVHELFLFLLKFTAFYKEPASNLKKFEKLFTAARNKPPAPDA
jgi:ornithine lipid ester-linked acyl 2-hydroxylase